MIKTYTIKDEVGLHARPVSLLVGVASKYPNEINITYGERTVTLKSIIAVMSLAVPYNDTIGIEVDGDNPEAIFNHIEETLKEHKVI